MLNFEIIKQITLARPSRIASSTTGVGLLQFRLFSLC